MAEWLGDDPPKCGEGSAPRVIRWASAERCRMQVKSPEPIHAGEQRLRHDAEYQMADEPSCVRLPRKSGWSRREAEQRRCRLVQ